jgi:hypothetical protein
MIPSALEAMNSPQTVHVPTIVPWTHEQSKSHLMITFELNNRGF